MRKAVRWTLLAAAGLLSPFLLYAAAALALSRLPVNADFRPATEGVLIGVIDNGVHADLLLPIRAAGIDWRDRFPLAAYPRLGWAPAELRFVSVGWGQREFYLETPSWAELRPAVAARALLGLGGTVLHVSYWPALKSSPQIVWTVLPVGAYRRLAAYVAGNLMLDGDGRTQPVDGAGYGHNDAFFAASGSYGPILTCNEWVGRGLATAGVRTGLWTPFPGAILDHLRAVPEA